MTDKLKLLRAISESDDTLKIFSRLEVQYKICNEADRLEWFLCLASEYATATVVYRQISQARDNGKAERLVVEL